jgi:hypothetical protein
MKVKTSEITGAALDWAVAKCEVFQYAASELAARQLQIGSSSTNWLFGGPIIEREQIALQYYQDGGHENGGEWLAYVLSGKDDDGFDNTIVTDGPTPLIAAMRCFVASKLGEEVEISEELA